MKNKINIFFIIVNALILSLIVNNLIAFNFEKNQIINETPVNFQKTSGKKYFNIEKDISNILLTSYSPVKETKLPIKSKQPIINNNEIPLTKLNFEVAGVIYSKKNKNKIAILRYKPENKFYTLKINEEINYLKLTDVLQNKVIIYNYKTRQKEYIPFDFNKEIININKGIEFKNKNAANNQKNQITVSRRKVNAKIKNNINNLLTLVEVKPNLIKGKIYGFKLVKAAKSFEMFLNSIGININDVIVRINGIIIKDIDTAYKLWNDVKLKDNFSLTILRNGKEETINYEMVK